MKKYGLKLGEFNNTTRMKVLKLLGQLHDFWRAYSLIVARLALFAPERSESANELRGPQIYYMFDKKHFFIIITTQAQIAQNI